MGHAPFSHSAEELFEGGIDHEEMTRRLLALPEIEEVFARHGEGLEPADVVRLLAGGGGPAERLLARIISGELDVDKMDYLLRDSLYCGVRYGSYDLERLLDTMLPIEDPETGTWGTGVDEGGVHALEALVMARYYMFTQVYFSVIGKALELHLARWLEEEGRHWSADPERFLAEDDLTVTARMRDSPSPHAAAVVRRGFTAGPCSARTSRCSFQPRQSCSACARYVRSTPSVRSATLNHPVSIIRAPSIRMDSAVIGTT